MGRLSDLFRRIGRASRTSRERQHDSGTGSWISVGGWSIGQGDRQADRDHDGIPDQQDTDSGGGSFGGGDSDGGDSDGGDSGGDD